jgi:hydroxymethylpyrimidine/phosphomethylpyrimidine kinase
MARAGKALLERGARAVLVKGGDLEGEEVVDILIDQEGERVFKGRRIISPRTRGTGCRFASAIACLLARGARLADAAATAKEYVASSLQSV